MLAVKLGVGEVVTFFQNHLLVVGNLGTECGQQITHDGGIDADKQGFAHGFGSELRTSSCETQESVRIDEAEQGDGSQDFFFAQSLFIFQWSSGDRT